MNAYIHATLDELVRLQFDARGFSLQPRQPVTSLLSGRHASRLRGRGLIFEELRDYRPGDDIRSIDWRATARLKKPHVRVYTEERERPVLLVVDQRAGMFFGSARTTKATAAAELAALGAWRAILGGDRVGAILFGDDELVAVRPHRSRSNALRICHELVRLNQRLSASSPRARPEMLNRALHQAAGIAMHDFLVVLITDYDGDDEETQRLASRIAAHNDVLAALVYDPLGAAFPPTINIEASDGASRVALNVTRQFSDRFEAEFRARIERIRQRLSNLRIPILPICTHDPVVEQVQAALGGR